MTGCHKITTTNVFILKLFFLIQLSHEDYMRPADDDGTYSITGSHKITTRNSFELKKMP
jgi:hypothetical protein